MLSCCVWCLPIRKPIAAKHDKATDKESKKRKNGDSSYNDSQQRATLLFFFRIHKIGQSKHKIIIRKKLGSKINDVLTNYCTKLPNTPMNTHRNNSFCFLSQSEQKDEEDRTQYLPIAQTDRPKVVGVVTRDTNTSACVHALCSQSYSSIS